MKLENLLRKLESIRIDAESPELDTLLDKSCIESMIIVALLEYINNPKVDDVVEAISF